MIGISYVLENKQAFWS